MRFVVCTHLFSVVISFPGIKRIETNQCEVAKSALEQISCNDDKIVCAARPVTGVFFKMVHLEGVRKSNKIVPVVQIMTATYDIPRQRNATAPPSSPLPLGEGQRERQGGAFTSCVTDSIWVTQAACWYFFF